MKILGITASSRRQHPPRLASNDIQLQHLTLPSHPASQALTSSSQALITLSTHIANKSETSIPSPNHSFAASAPNVILSPKLSAMPCVLLLILTCP